MSTSTETQGAAVSAPVTTIALPPVLLGGELQHLFCSATDPEEFLAAASAWLEFFVLAQQTELDEAEVWRRVQAAHNAALLMTRDASWRAELAERLEDSLLKIPTYRQLWDTLPNVSDEARTLH